MKNAAFCVLLTLLAACDGDDAPASAGTARVFVPAADTVVNRAELELAWDPVDGADGYRVRVYVDEARTVLHEEISTGETAVALSTPLPEGIAYAVVEARSEGSTVSSAETRVRYIAVPSWMPSFTLKRREAGHESGYRLFNLVDLNEGDDPTGAHLAAIVLVDDEGKVIWWYRHTSTGNLADARVLPNGNLLLTYWSEKDGEGRYIEAYAFEITWEGQVVWQSRPDVMVHHEAGLGPNDDYLYMTWTYRDIGGRTIEGDGLEIVDPNTGAVLWQWDMFDHFEFDQWPTPETETTNFSGFGADWSHSNAAVWDAARGVIWVSARHFDAVFAVEYPSGDVVTILGRGGLGGEGLVRHQHAPEVQPDGSLLLWDNGNGRGPPPYSRVVQLSVDEQAGTVEEVWEWRDAPDIFDFAVGDADRLPNGNVQATAGVSGRILEITPDKRIVWELQVSGSDGWWFYRSEHLSSAQVPDHVEPFGG